MGTGRWLFACAVFAVACGAKSIKKNQGDGTGDDGGGFPTDADCRLSFGCPTGERCDDGECVPDDGCPGAREPELLFEAPGGSPWAEVYNPYFAVMEGREYLLMTERDASGSFTDLSRFLDLRTGKELLFTHVRGGAGCFGTPARCGLRSETALSLVEVEIGTDTVSLREETALSFVGYNHMFSSDTDYREGRVVVVADTFVDLYELGRAAPLASIGLAGKHFMDLLVDADGRSESVVSWVQENQVEGEPSEAAVTALETGASPTIVYRGLGSRVAAVITLPDGDDWFALRDGRVDEPAVSVYRNSVLLGSVDADWAWKVDDEYRTRERPLEPGPSAYVRHCDESGCASHRFHLDPPSLEEVATVALPEPGLRAYYSRAIACGGADLWVVTQAVPGDATRHWAMRIPGRAGFP